MRVIVDIEMHREPRLLERTARFLVSAAVSFAVFGALIWVLALLLP